MIPNRIRKVLFSLQASGVRHLLMGGQACVLYGGVEFSRDIDCAVLADEENLTRLSACLAMLQAEVVAVPEFLAEYLERGHSIHFRCHHPDAEGMRLDILSIMRGVDPFPMLWERRTTFLLEDGFAVDALNLWDLVRAKKTQRDKDWPMIRRLLEANYVESEGTPTQEQLQFWLLELRTPTLLIEVARSSPDAANALTPIRPLLASALAQDEARLTVELTAEEQLQRQEDRAYWTPLRLELEQLRHKLVKKPGL